MTGLAGLAAWVVVGLHVGYLLYQAFGGLLALRGRWWLVPHLVAVAWGITVVVMQWRCPLTRLERALSDRAGRPAYRESFLDHYVFGSVLPDGTQALVYGLHLLGIVAIYALLWHRSALAGRREPAAV